MHLLQFLAGPNLLTGNTNEHWQAVRKGIAPAFSVANMRCFLPCIVRDLPLLAAASRPAGRGLHVL